MRKREREIKRPRCGAPKRVARSGVRYGFPVLFDHFPVLERGRVDQGAKRIQKQVVAISFRLLNLKLISSSGLRENRAGVPSLASERRDNRNRENKPTAW
jgi:hypothetical protein